METRAQRRPASIWWSGPVLASPDSCPSARQDGLRGAIPRSRYQCCGVPGWPDRLCYTSERPVGARLAAEGLGSGLMSFAATVKVNLSATGMGASMAAKRIRPTSRVLEGDRRRGPGGRRFCTSFKFRHRLWRPTVLQPQRRPTWLANTSLTICSGAHKRYIFASAKIPA